MRKIRFGLLVIVVYLLTISCGNHINTDENHSSRQKNESATGIINLNNGERWMVNEEMQPFIRKSERVLDEYDKSESSDYKTLAVQLKKQNSALIKSCTMKGESHDELHKWLHPHMELIEALEQAENLDEAEAIVSKLEKSFETYHQYFQ